MNEIKCKYFAVPDTGFRGKCGGCATQHIAYELQLKNKKDRVIRASKFEDVKVFSGNDFFYRNRMDMVFTEKGIGFRQKGSWKWRIDIDFCPLSNHKLNDLIKEVRDDFSDVDDFDPQTHNGTYKYAVIRTPQNDSSISFMLNKDSFKCAEAVEKIKTFAKKTTANNILVSYVGAKTDMSISEEYIVIKGSDNLRESFLGKEFTYNVQGFFQNNHEMAEEMHKYVNNILKENVEKKRKTVSELHLLDIYAGVGTFGIINSDLFDSVKIVESFQGCIDSANENIKINNIKNAEAICSDAKQLKNIKLKENIFIVTDPPRAGMHPNTIIELLKIKSDLIVYISCNIKQLEKDLPKFKKIYKIKSVAVFDLFPQTNHMETVVELIKK